MNNTMDEKLLILSGLIMLLLQPILFVIGILISKNDALWTIYFSARSVYNGLKK